MSSHEQTAARYPLGENAHEAKRAVFGEADPKDASAPGNVWVGEVLHTAKHEGYEPLRSLLEEWKGGRREGLIACPYFTLDRHAAALPFRVGSAGRCKAVVCVGGRGELESNGVRHPLSTGDVGLLPADGPARERTGSTA